MWRLRPRGLIAYTTIADQEATAKGGKAPLRIIRPRTLLYTWLIALVGLIIGLFSWPYISRIIRGQVLSMREKEFVEASRSLGATNFRIMAREILPNVAAPLIVYTTLIIPANILFEAGLSFLGVCVPDEVAS